MARLRGIRWLWFDGVCIDKRSSAELGECINSMFKYYQQAVQCFAFLPDVQADHKDQAAVEKELYASVWFKRGWTLQELLASNVINFYNSRFQLLGIKDQKSAFTNSAFTETISRITGIGIHFLRDPTMIRTASIAERMRWASKRQTLRIEDLAYSLLGIFDVNMPLLYGEGEKSFMRLQVEIIRKSEDESIYAWHTSHPDWKGLLAPNPAAFAGTDVIEMKSIHQRLPATMTNKGLQLSLTIPGLQYLRSDIPILFPLNCIRIIEGPPGMPPQHYQLALRIHVTSTLDPHNSGLRILDGSVCRDSHKSNHFVASPISKQLCTIAYTRANKKVRRWRYTAKWKSHEQGSWEAYGCCAVVGVFPRGESGEGVAWPVYFGQDGL